MNILGEQKIRWPFDKFKWPFNNIPYQNRKRNISSEKKACPPVDGADGLVVGVQVGCGRVRRGRPQAVDALGESGRVDAPGRQQDGGVDAVGVGRRVVARLGELLLVALSELVEGALEAGQARVLLVHLRRHLLGVLQQLLEVHCGRQLCVWALQTNLRSQIPIVITITAIM